MRWCWFAAFAALMVPMARADETISGWTVEFRQDTFSGEVFPVAKLAESTDGFASRASLAAACVAQNRFVFGFFDGEIFSFDSAITVDFKTADGVQSFTFTSRDVPPKSPVGKHLNGNDSEKLQAILGATKELPFRAGKKQGVFKPIGTADALAIMSAKCL